MVAKVVGSPQVSGNHSVTSRNRSGFIRLLNFVSSVTFSANDIIVALDSVNLFSFLSLHLQLVGYCTMASFNPILVFRL